MQPKDQLLIKLAPPAPHDVMYARKQVRCSTLDKHLIESSPSMENARGNWALYVRDEMSVFHPNDERRGGC